MRKLLCCVVLMLAGCGASIEELQAKRSELQRIHAETSGELALLKLWFTSMPTEDRQVLEVMVDGIRGDDYIDTARDARQAKVDSLTEQIARLDKQLEAKVR